MNATALKHQSVLWRRVAMSVIGFCVGVILYGVTLACDYKCTMCGERSYGEPVYLDKEYPEVKHVPLCGRCSGLIVEWRKVSEAQLELVTKKLREGK